MKTSEQENCLRNDFDPNIPETFTSFHEEFAKLRSKCPVAHTNELGGYWALTRYDDIVKTATDTKTFTSGVQSVVPKQGSMTQRNPPLDYDPPEHSIYRRVIDPFFTKERVDKLEEPLRRRVVELLQPLIKKEQFDISQEFGNLLPPYSVAEVLNLPTDIALEIRYCFTNEELLAAQQKGDIDLIIEVVNKNQKMMSDIGSRVVQMRKTNPVDSKLDLISAMLEAKDANGEPLPDYLIEAAVTQLLAVGMVAPSVFVGSMAVHLAQNKKLQHELRNDLTLIPAAVEEFLRLFTTYRGFARTARKDIEIEGRLIKKDEPIALVYASGNRDETVFPTPDEFILNRPNISKSLAFGMGPHKCPGAPVARLLFRITLEELLSRTQEINLDGDVKMAKWPEWGTTSVPLKVFSS